MKIAQFDDSYFPVIDGVAIVIDNYTRILNAKGHESFVVSIDIEDAKDDYGYRVLRFKSITNPVNKIYRWPMCWFDSKMKKKLKKEPMDLIHIHTPFMVGHYAIRLAKKRKIPSIVTFHTKFYYDLLEALHVSFFAKIGLYYIMKVYKKADYVIGVSEYTREVLKSYGYKGEVKVIPHGCDLVKPADAEERIRAIKEGLELKDEEIFLFVGAHNEKKNIRKIYDALEVYKVKKPNFKLIMVGSGLHEKKIQKYGKKLGLEDNIIYMGRIADREKLINLYLAADLFLFPSIYDTFGLVVKEAAVCETPSVVVRNHGPSEGIIHNKNGFLCQNDVGSISDTIEVAMSDKERLKAVGEEAARTLPKTWEEVVTEVETFYQEILNEKSSL